MEAFEKNFDLNSLNGENGFILNEEGVSKSAGTTVSSAGDVNGDGIDDIIIGAPSHNQGLRNAGKSYLVFGRSGKFEKDFSLSDLDGSNGVILNGRKIDGLAGSAVSGAGDINSDGFDDLIIGARNIPSSREVAYDTGPGLGYVVFGQEKFDSGNQNLSDLNGQNGFVIKGAEIDDLTGWSVSGTGDVNGDSIDDLIVGAPSARDGDKKFVGKSYVVFGKKKTDQGFSRELNVDELDGSNGFEITGEATLDRAGMSVSSAGDVNDDGINDLIIGAPNAREKQNRPSAGKSYVVFGKNQAIDTFSSKLNLSDLEAQNGRDGFVITSPTTWDHSGASVSVSGDINGDGVDDLLIGADLPSGLSRTLRGEDAYVIYGGKNRNNGRLDLGSLDGTNGFVMNHSGNAILHGTQSVSSAGDINDDGYDDLIWASGNTAHVVYGGENIDTKGKFTFDNSSLDGENGFKIPGLLPSDGLASSVSAAGDVNNDGIDDLLIGASRAGKSYVIFGRRNGDQSSNQAPKFTSASSFTVDENTTLVADLTVTDDKSEEGKGLTYSLTSGEDQSQFSLSPDTGVLSFVTAPDFEMPRDVSTDNLYRVNVTVTDAGGLSDTELLSIRVADVNENPPATGKNLIGTDGRDTLTGMNGDDVLIGKGSRDVLTGGGGRDQFVFQSLDDRSDRINDFEIGQDKIVLTDMFKSLGINVDSYQQATQQGYLEVLSLGRDDSRIKVDFDGSEGRRLGRTLAITSNVSAIELNSANNFVI